MCFGCIAIGLRRRQQCCRLLQGHAEVELLLEAYLMEVDSLLVKVKHVRHSLEALERCVRSYAFACRVHDPCRGLMQ